MTSEQRTIRKRKSGYGQKNSKPNIVTMACIEKELNIK
jgi:hypothetical protein